MISEIGRGVLIPLLGTSLGAACVFVMKSNALNRSLQRLLLGFAAGVMTAASVWSLIIPAVTQAGAMGRLAFIPAAAGLWIGVLFLSALERLSPFARADSDILPDRTAMLVLAVTLHNLPEGMAVGVVYAGRLQGSAGVTAAGALALALGIAIQNFPEGAIISMPLRAEGRGRGRAFLAGVLSGVIEPVGALLTLLFSGLLTPLMPYFLGFAAGAMLHVAAGSLIPEAADGAPLQGALMFSLGFTVMMALDVALG